MCVPPFKYSDFKQIFHINQNCRIVYKLKYKLNTKSESPLSTSTSLVESGLSAWSSCPGVCAQQPLCGVWLQGREERVSLALQPVQPCLLLMPHADPGHCIPWLSGCSFGIFLPQPLWKMDPQILYFKFAMILFFFSIGEEILMPALPVIWFSIEY